LFTLREAEGSHPFSLVDRFAVALEFDRFAVALEFDRFGVTHVDVRVLLAGHLLPSEVTHGNGGWR
jgi:hypothetical protein